MEGVGPSPIPERVTSGQQWKDALVNAFESQGKRDDVGVMEQGGYLYFATTEYYQSQLYDIYGLHHQVLKSPRGEIAQIIDRQKELLSGEFKIHLQVKPEYIPFFVSQVAKFWQDEGQGLFDCLKARTRPATNDHFGQPLPEIVIYSRLGRENAREIVMQLQRYLSGFEHLGTGITPRYNAKVSELIFIAQSGGDLKNVLSREGLIDNYFDKSTGYAFMQGEAARWAGVIRGTQSENPPERAEGLGIRSIDERPVTIGGARNFDELYQAIDKLGGLQGSRDYFTAEELKQFIKEVRQGNRDLQYITRTGNLRMKVKELLGGRK